MAEQAVAKYRFAPNAGFNSIAVRLCGLELPKSGASGGRISKMKSYNIAVMGGDGTGPEVVREAVKVLDVVSKKFGIKLNYTNYDLGGERYLRTNEALPDSIV